MNKDQKKKKAASKKSPILVGIIMGSSSDADTMTPAKEILRELGIACEFKVISAHRTPDEMFEYAETARSRGIEVIIAGAGGSAHLPGMVASKTTLPVIGVPVKTKSLHGMDSLLSIVQMPKGIPVATVAIDGGANAGLLAARILSIKHPDIAKKLEGYKDSLRNVVLKMKV